MRVSWLYSRARAAFAQRSRGPSDKTARWSSPPGEEVRDVVTNLYEKHVRTVEQVGGISAEGFVGLNKALQRLERFWTDQILYRL